MPVEADDALATVLARLNLTKYVKLLVEDEELTTPLLRTMDNKGNTFHIVKPSIEGDSKSALLIVDNTTEKMIDKENHSVSIRYMRRPKNITISAKKHDQQGHFETDRGGNLNKVVKHSVLLQ